MIAFTETRPDTGDDILVLSIDNNEDPRAFLKTEFNETDAKFSPDGNWIAYTSDASGRSEVYVQPFPGPGRRWQVSTNGGARPVWTPNGQELFYRHGDRMMVVLVGTEQGFSLGAPRFLFERWTFAGEYDVAPDGENFILIDSIDEFLPLAELILVQNWHEELERLVPANQ